MMQSDRDRRASTCDYYRVTNQQDLVTPINTIAGQIISCSFMLQRVPPYPDQVTVTANGQVVPRDPTHTARA